MLTRKLFSVIDIIDDVRRLRNNLLQSEPTDSFMVNITVVQLPGHSRSTRFYTPHVPRLPPLAPPLKRDIGRKSWFFSYPHAFDAPVRGSPSEYCHLVWYGKTRMVGLPDGEQKYEDMYNRLEYQRVTDRRTDRRTNSLPGHISRCALRVAR